MYTDSHIHLADYYGICEETASPPFFPDICSYCFSTHRRAIFEHQQKLIKKSSLSCRPCFFSFGIHPQLPTDDELEYLALLLQKKQIHAIGECGFDLFTEEYRQTLCMQKRVWHIQLDYARAFNLPIVIHCRKALPLIFESVPVLKQLPAVVFHGWSGSPAEAAAFLKKGVNAYFSIGKAVLRGQKTVCAAAACLDIHRLLTETDAPYMRLKNEALTHPADIQCVVERIARLRGIAYMSDGAAGEARTYSSEYYSFLTALKENFYRVFNP